MRALDRKMLRDLRKIWAQVLAIALVLGCGVMVLVGAQATQATLIQTQAAYYERHRFADVFAGATRAPSDVVAAAALIPGVAQAEGRISFQAVLDIEGMAEPASGRILSLPAAGPALNLPLLRHGRLPDPDRADEVALSEPFAEIHGLTPGSRLRGVLNGQMRDLTVTGWVLSPEFIYTMPPGAMMPDDRRYGLLWMNAAAAAAAMDMSGAVNDIALRLTRDADERAVIAALDQLLDPYGGTGAYGRARQVSHAFLDGELQQLGAMAAFMPPIFLIVAAFLVNMVLGRLIALERTQIGLLKALGYGRAEIAGHYLKLALLIGVIGVVVGWGFGWWIADAMIGLYGDFFRFPFIIRDWGTHALVVSAVLGLATAVLGGLRAVWSSLKLPPAEAMQPPAPPSFARGAADRVLGALHLRQTTMMIFRSILRWPGRAAITLFGVSASVGVLVMSYFIFDAVEQLGDSVFQQANRQQVTLMLAQAQPDAAVQDALTLPGVLRAEGAFAMPVRGVNGHLSRLTAVQGHFPDAQLSRLVDDAGRVVTPGPHGVVLPEMLAHALDIRAGDTLRLEMLAAPRSVLHLPVTEVIRQGMGQEAHISAAALFAAMDIAPQVNMIHLAVQSDRMADLNAAIKETPAVAGLSDWAEVRRQFDATLSENLLTMVGIYTVIGVLIAIGVVYNAARIQLSERSYELASLRVLGFSRAEVGYVLVGEMMLLTLLAIPLGWGLGYFLAMGLVGAMSTDMFQIPFHITRRTFALAALAVFVAATGSVLMVRRRLDKVNLATALKARD
ncbi:putative ABC transport system permease protein [Roseinatronobacter thiooxidans]|uniref:Putative ABC transport system permease protein n=1 Tax=Roseinatronobacter thiooxidans TaxID=121821 RepID=A0A2W7PYW5_9RHOB|nr:ABC transporter permease [Roseinatronobacter thiooxidans]PZX40733.1 putative ABC transport system permease protein [Roseinatronobacter thiooxidans]